MEEKVKVSQDVLYQYLQEHGVIVSMLQKKMGVSKGLVDACFRHDLNRHGKPMKFSANALALLNAAVAEVADELRGCLLHFGSPQAFTNQRGTTYDPALVEGFRRIGEYVKLRGLTARVLGWNKAKSEGTLSVKSAPMYGRISQADADRVNAELLAMAGVLGSYEVVADEGTAADDESNI